MNNTQKLIGYLSEKLESIYQIYVSFEDNLSENKISLANSDISEQDIHRACDHLEYIEANLFRQAMLIMVCSFLEEAMNLIGEAAIPDFSVKISKKRKVNWFDKHRRLFEGVGVSFKEIEDKCERIKDLVIVRNCIVHAGGRIEKCRCPAKVEKAVERLKERDRDMNTNLVEITDNKFLYLGDNIIAMTIFASEEIIKQCSKANCRKN